MRRPAALSPLVAAVLLLAGCSDGSGGGSGGGSPSPGPSSGASAPPGSITVFAAASLTEAFDVLGRQFEAANPGTSVTFSYGGSSGLAQQINSGSPADVFAAASPATMKTVTDAGNATGPAVFARNQLVIAVPKGNPKGVTGLANLTKPGVKVALCAAQVPCGAAAQTALTAAGVRLTPVTLEQDVRAALTKVRLGEVDAALVYRTDVGATADEVSGVEFPESAKAINDYQIVVLAHAPNPALAQAFVAYLRSAAGLAALTAAGFQTP